MTPMRMVFAVTLFGALVVGCGKSESKQAEKQAPPLQQAEVVKAPVAPVQPVATTKVEGAMGDVIAAYMAVHASLFTDKTDGVADAAGVIAQAAPKAAEGAADAAKPHYAALAEAAGALGSAADIAAARLAFGEVSKHLVAIMEMTPELAKLHHVFECPMAKGYKKWIQTTSELANPYMGTQMPKCGAKVAFGGGEHDMPAGHEGMKHDMPSGHEGH